MIIKNDFFNFSVLNVVNLRKHVQTGKGLSIIGRDTWKFGITDLLYTIIIEFNFNPRITNTFYKFKIIGFKRALHIFISIILVTNPR